MASETRKSKSQNSESWIVVDSSIQVVSRTNYLSDLNSKTVSNDTCVEFYLPSYNLQNTSVSFIHLKPFQVLLQDQILLINEPTSSQRYIFSHFHHESFSDYFWETATTNVKFDRQNVWKVLVLFMFNHFERNILTCGGIIFARCSLSTSTYKNVCSLPDQSRHSETCSLARLITWELRKSFQDYIESSKSWKKNWM